jgi:phosphatidate cytidylyltransferase
MLKQRIITALILLPLVLALVFYAPIRLFAVAIAIMAAIGAWEWTRLSGYTDRQTRFLQLLGFGLLVVLVQVVQRQLPHPQDLLLLCGIGLAWWVFSLVWVALWRAEFTRPLKLLCGTLTLLPSAAAFIALRRTGPVELLALLILVWAADIGAYFTGRAFGRHKLAPLVSPGKTWEGVLGGLLAAGLAAAVACRWLPAAPMPFILICMAVSLISVLGDLSESLFKRQAGLKDSGTLFPGHGGVLDRVDSLTAAAPAFWLGLYLLGAVP